MAPLDGARVGREGRMPTAAGLALGLGGKLAVADPNGHRIWTRSSSCLWSILAGGAYGWRDGSAAEALFRYPSDVAFGPDGTCFVADTGNDRIRTISPDGEVATLAGSTYDYGDGKGANARFRRPMGRVVDENGACYVADTGNNAIRRITPDGSVTTLAGLPPGGDADGVGREVGLRWPSGLGLGDDGWLWIADHGNGALRRLAWDGACSTRVRLPPRQWPVAVTSLSSGTALVLASSYDSLGRPEGLLLVVDDSS